MDNEIELQLTEVSVADRIPRKSFLFSTLDMDTLRSAIMDALEIRLWGYCLTEELEQKEHTFFAQYPATWWDHFKKRFLPWMKVTHTIIQETVIFKAKAYYPRLEAMQFPNAKGAVIKLSKTSWRDTENLA